MTTETLFLTDATHYSPADLARIVAEQLAQPYPASDNLRSAAGHVSTPMDCSLPSQWHPRKHRSQSLVGSASVAA